MGTGSEQGKINIFWGHKHFSVPPHFCYVIKKINTIKPQKKCGKSNKVLTFPMMNTSVVSSKYQILYSFETNFKKT